MSLNLLEKTELWVDEIRLEKVNLTELSKTTARVLGIAEDKVMVVDVRPTHITFDILQKEIPQENIMGKEEELLDELGKVPGVFLTADSFVHSNGILGLICAQTGENEEVMHRVDRMREEMVQRINHRAIVFPTGFELEKHMIEDTNTPYIAEKLKEQGYSVDIGSVIPDDEAEMVEVLSDALSRGYGLILTSGGVGAEDKDHSVESVKDLDPEAATPYIVKYHKGTGRHVKDGVRIAVGKVGVSTIVTFPGPHDEVMMALPVLLREMKAGSGKEAIAQALAGTLAKKWETTVPAEHNGGATEVR